VYPAGGTPLTGVYPGNGWELAGGCALAGGWVGMLTGAYPDPACGAVEGTAPTCVPHTAQKWLPAGSSAPHFPQRTAMTISWRDAVKRNSSQTGRVCAAYPGAQNIP
jgi:hypothetical protein